MKFMVLFIYVLIMEQHKKTQEEMKRRILANTYGAAFPMKMDLDAQILSRYEFELPVSDLYFYLF